VLLNEENPGAGNANVWLTDIGRPTSSGISTVCFSAHRQMPKVEDDLVALHFVTFPQPAAAGASSPWQLESGPGYRSGHTRIVG